ncbi:MAG TPA: EAL domain-containing protein [Gemmatimonadales bacterium]|nr:EAL domain-containing protein [Gemmatimonadales bacterium]
MTAPSPRPPASWRNTIPPVGPVVLVTAVYGLFYLFWERSGLGSTGFRDLIGNAGFMPLNAALATLCFLASGRMVLDPGVRRALRLMGIGSLSVLIGNSVSVYYVLLRGEGLAVSWADLFYLADSGFLLAALLAFPLSRRIHLEWWKFVLDATMVIVGGVVVIWYFTVLPGAPGLPDGRAGMVINFAFPIASLLVLLGITTVLLRGPIDRNRWAFGLLVGGVLLSVVADLTFGLIQLQTGERGATFVDAVYLLVYLLLIASADLYRRRPVPRIAGTEEYQPRSQPLSPLPYAAVAITFGLLLVEAFQPGLGPVTDLAVWAVTITALVVVRQVLAVRQNVRLLAETAARQNEARFRSLVQHSSDVILVVEADGTIQFVSPSAARVLRYDPDRLLGLPVQSLLVVDDRERAIGFLRDASNASSLPAPIEWGFRQPDGSALQTETIATNLIADPTVRGIVLNIRDVSERTRLQQELVHQAFHDSLTGLANRALFRDRVSHALAIARRQGRDVTVLYLDLDDFKKVNDSLGHTEGDRLLKSAADRFLACARATDTVARLGGDEFGILIEDVHGSDGPGNLIERLTGAMQAPFRLGHNEVPVTASFGVATAMGGETADDLLRNADLAMYTAKRQGKGRYATYESQMVTDTRQRLDLEVALRTAIARDEMVLHYQPIMHLQTGEIFGFEALVRWNHPRFGHMLPQHFVPLAEETGLIVRLGGWVLREACAQIQRWRVKYPEARWPISVNLSGRQLQEPELVHETRTALALSGVEPSALVLEITESILMQQADSAQQQLRAMKALGVGLAIDDFGTGYSSLSYLQRFPIDILKIAKPFIDDVGAGVERSALARAIIGLGDTLKLKTIAEGVEIAEQREALVALGCELGQGHYFARAMEVEAVERMLEERGVGRPDGQAARRPGGGTHRTRAASP